ncbi:MAG: chromosomal replication initiator protein DnaA [Eubacteriales Family XIII. Incertae Sedis bacterium]|nr:MAG: chromosomal replication initiator protein DnaA [Clostridiales Family XIII bacterium]
MTKLKEKWNQVLALLEPELTEISFSTWFKPIKVKSIDEKLNIIHLTIDNNMAVDLIKDRYKSILENTIKIVYGNDFGFTIEYFEEDELLINNVGDKEPEFKDELYLNPRYNFKNFVVGNNNKFAHAAAVAVAEAPSEAYNPLFLYGGSGLGKTHLMHAIGHHILKTKSNLKVLYVSSEMFVNEMVSALRKNDLRNENNMGEFRRKYREIDVLLIDDIQFLENKASIQEEFFNTFNTLYTLNKQIIISSDRPPNKLVNMDVRLRSRFQWNLVADITPPDYETRVAILINRAELDNIEIDEDMNDVINLIAEKIQENVRELEGALTRIISFSKLLEEKIDIPFARKILKDILSAADFNVTPENIKKKVCKHFNIKIADIESAKRARQFAFPRQIAMYLCREMTDLSLPKIGECFGGRDHSTVLHAYEKISSDIKTNDSVKEIVATLESEISGK